MKKLLYTLAILISFAVSSFAVDATATQCYINAQATATAAAVNVIASATAAATLGFVPTMTYVANQAVIARQTAEKACDNIVASYTVTNTFTKTSTFTMTSTFTATPSITRTGTPTFTMTMFSRGEAYFHATPYPGKILLVDKTALNPGKFIDYISVDSLTNTTESFRLIKIYNGSVLLKQVQIQKRNGPWLIQMYGIRADNLYIDYGANTGTCTVKLH